MYGRKDGRMKAKWMRGGGWMFVVLVDARINGRVVGGMVG
jgi:hypothetical protein